MTSFTTYIQNLEEEADLEQLFYTRCKPKACPICGQNDNDYLLNWDEDNPPLTRYILTWTCENCMQDFTTYWEMKP